MVVQKRVPNICSLQIIILLALCGYGSCFNFTIDGQVHNYTSLILNGSSVSANFLSMNATAAPNATASASYAAAVYKEAISLTRDSNTSKANGTENSFSTSFILSVDTNSLYSNGRAGNLVFAMSPTRNLEESFRNSSREGNFGIEIMLEAFMEVSWWGQATYIGIQFLPAGYAYRVSEFDLLNMGDGSVSVATLNDRALSGRICSTTNDNDDDDRFAHLQVTGQYDASTDELQVGFTRCSQGQLQVIRPAASWGNLSKSFAGVDPYIGFLSLLPGSVNISDWEFTLNPAVSPAALNSSLYTSVQYFNATAADDSDSPYTIRRVSSRSISRRVMGFIIGFSVAGAAVLIVAAAVVAVILCRNRRRRRKMINANRIHAAPDDRPAVALQPFAVARSTPTTVTATATAVADTVPLNRGAGCSSSDTPASLSLSSDSPSWLRPVAPR